MTLKLKPIFKNIILTFIIQALVLVAFFLIYRLIAKNFGPEGVGVYSLTKKIIGFLQPLLLLGIGIGLPRYIAMSKNPEQRSSYLKTGGLIVIPFVFVFLIFINIFKEYFAKIFFGSINYTTLVLPFSFFLAGLILHSLIYSYFRGRLFVKTFNSLQIINLALVPVIILTFFKNITIEKLITLIGIITFVIAFIFSLSFIKEFFIPIEKWQFKKSFKELFQYSLPRVPAIFAKAGLFSLGPIFATHFTSIKEVGFLSVSQSLLGTIIATISPLGIILLPKVSNMIAQKREQEIKENLNYLIGATIQLSIFVSFQLIIFADIIINYWLGPKFLGAVPVMRIVFLSVFFYSLYEATRNILDAAKVRPINTINLFISLGVFLIIASVLLFLVKFFTPIISLSIALTFATLCLGVLTYISVRKIYYEKLSKDLNYLWTAIVINILLGGVAILVKSFIVLRFYYLVTFEILLGIIYLSILWLLKMEWIRKIPKRILLQP